MGLRIMIQITAIQRYICMPACQVWELVLNPWWYALPIPKNYNNYNIVHLEVLNIVVALKVWAVHWSNKRISDNMAVVEVL